MGVFMRNVSRDQIVANFEELVADNQIQTATDLLISAEPDEQVLVVLETQPELLAHFLQALDLEDKLEVTDQLAPEARQALLQAQKRAVASERPADGESPDGGAVVIRTVEELAERATETGSAEGAAALPGRLDFAIVDGRLRETAPGAGVVTVYTNPTSAAQREQLESLGIDEHMLESALDPDEISRLEYDEEERKTFIVLKRPRRDTDGHPELLEVDSIGALLEADHLTIVTTDDSQLVRDGDRAESPLKLLLRIMASTVNEFLVELKRVKRTSSDIQAQLTKSLGNHELLQMFSLSEGLVYHINAIEANSRVLRKLRHISPRLAFDERDSEFLDDIIIDNDQCSRQGQIFSTILAGMLDARGNVINNNMNVLLKNLTTINVVFLPLTLIASIGGMSEFSMMLGDYSVGWQAGYAGFFLAMILLGLAIWWLVSGVVSRKWGH